MNEVKYKEVQKMNFLVVGLLLLLVSVPTYFLFYYQIILGELPPIGSRPLPDFIVIILTIVFGVGMPVFFLNIKLITTVERDGISVRYFPIASVFYNFPEINKIEKRTFSPLNEFSGWGIRWGYKIKCYTMSGKQGLQIELNDRKKILIGTRNPEELYSAVIAAKELAIMK